MISINIDLRSVGNHRSSTLTKQIYINDINMIIINDTRQTIS